MGIIETILWCVGGASAVILLVNFVIWRLEIDSSAPMISYKTFYELYKLFPERWSLCDTYLRYENIESRSWQDQYKVVEFQNCVDMMRAKWLFFRAGMSKTSRNRRRRQAELCELLLRDIEKVKKENSEEMQEALDKSKEALMQEEVTNG